MQSQILIFYHKKKKSVTVNEKDKWIEALMFDDHVNNFCLKFGLNSDSNLYGVQWEWRTRKHYHHISWSNFHNIKISRHFMYITIYTRTNFWFADSIVKRKKYGILTQIMIINMYLLFHNIFQISCQAVWKKINYLWRILRVQDWRDVTQRTAYFLWIVTYLDDLSTPHLTWL